MSNKLEVSPENLIDFLEAIEGPRIDRTKRHELIDILVIAICAAVSGAKNWVEIEDFGNAKIDWFSNFLNLKHGIPSHDTFRRVFILLNPDQFRESFIGWVKAVTKDTDLKQICIDGKVLRRSFKRGKSYTAVHMVNAWSTGASLCLEQMKCDDKTIEIKIVPKLLDLLDIKGHIVTADALNCQVKIAEKILEKEGEYLLALKGNHKFLKERVQKKFTQKNGPGSRSFIKDMYTKKDEGHGRIEKRRNKF